MSKRLSTAQRHVKIKRRIHVHVSNASVAGVSSYHAAISRNIVPIFASMQRKAE